MRGMMYAVVISLSMVFYKRMGVGNLRLLNYTAWLLLPMVFRPVLALLVCQLRNNIYCILLSELIMAGALFGIGYAVNSQSWFGSSYFFFWLMAFSAVFHDIATDHLEISSRHVYHPSELLPLSLQFYRFSILIVLGIIVMFVGNMEVVTRVVKGSWSTAFNMLAGIVLLFFVLNFFLIRKLDRVRNKRGLTMHGMFYASLNTTADLIRTPKAWPGFLFLLFYLVPLILLVRVSTVFFLDLESNGGAGLSPQEFGLVQGTVGAISAIIGGMLGGLVLRRFGIRQMLFPMTLGMVMPTLLMFTLSYSAYSGLFVMAAVLFFVDLCVGFIFSAYLHYLFYYSEVKMTASYSMFMALISFPIMVSALLSGPLLVRLGYHCFFFLCFSLIALSLLVSIMIYADKELR